MNLRFTTTLYLTAMSSVSATCWFSLRRFVMSRPGRVRSQATGSGQVTGQRSSWPGVLVWVFSCAESADIPSPWTLPRRSAATAEAHSSCCTPSRCRACRGRRTSSLCLCSRTTPASNEACRRERSTVTWCPSLRRSISSRRRTRSR